MFPAITSGRSTASENRRSWRSRWAAALAVVLMCALLTLPVHAAEPVCGHADETISAEGSLVDESALGNALADALVFATGADAAVFPGGLLGDDILPGAQTAASIERVLPADSEIVLADIAVEQLKSLLENGVSRIVLDERERIDREKSPFDGFLHVSGVSFRYDATGFVGDRVDDIRDIDGALLDEQTVLCVAMPAEVARGVYGGDAVDTRFTGVTARDCLAAWMEAEDPVSEPDDGRIRIRGSTEQTIYSEYIPAWILFPAVAVIGAVQYKVGRYERRDEF